ncbi:hypothetical protein D3C72_1404370 [compost metagenome]
MLNPSPDLPVLELMLTPGVLPWMASNGFVVFLSSIVLESIVLTDPVTSVFLTLP